MSTIGKKMARGKRDRLTLPARTTVQFSIKTDPEFSFSPISSALQP